MGVVYRSVTREQPRKIEWRVGGETLKHSLDNMELWRDQAHVEQQGQKSAWIFEVQCDK